MANTERAALLDELRKALEELTDSEIESVAAFAEHITEPTEST